MTIAHSLKWSFFGEIASKAITPIVFVVLARLLTPADFGVMAAAAMVIAFSQIFWEAGMGKALIQRQRDVPQAADVAFWINIALGLLIAALLFLTSEAIADAFFQDPRVANVLRLMTLQVMLGAISSVHIALLQKEMHFKELFWVRFAAVGIPGVASIPLAIYGMGYWALVAGSIAGQCAQVLMLWRISSWRPTWHFDLTVARDMGRFGAWVGASGVLAWFYAWADSLVVGMHFTPHELGLYRTGNQFSTMIFALAFGPIVPVLYSHLSRLQKQADEFKNTMETVITIIIIIAIPTALIVYNLSDFLGTRVFGSRWDGVGFIIGIMALVHGGSWIIGMNGEAYRAMGRPQLETLVMLIASSVYLAVYVYAAKQSLETFVWARFYLMLLGLAIQLLILKAVLSISLMRIFIWIASSITITFAAILLSSWLMTAEDMAPELQFTILAAFWLATALVAIGIVRTQFLTLRMETR